MDRKKTWSFHIQSKNYGTQSHLSALGAMVRPSNLYPYFPSVYVHDTVYVVQAPIRSEAVTIPLPAILQQLTAMLYKHKPFAKTFVSLRDCVTPFEASKTFLMVMRAIKKTAIWWDIVSYSSGNYSGSRGRQCPETGNCSPKIWWT